MRKVFLLTFAFLCAIVQGAWAWEGSGTSSDPYQISSQTDWNTLATNVNGGENYSGKYFKLTADISITEMAGTSTYGFSGNFDGNGKKLDFTVNTSEQFTAPFRYVDDATIENLIVEGTITSTAMHSAGIIGLNNGTTTVTNCLSDVIINSQVEGDGTHGGLVADNHGTLTIEGCAFTGKLLNSSTTCWGGLLGWNKVYSVSAKVTLKNCIFAPAECEATDGRTLARSDSYSSSYVKIDNCYYLQSFGTAQGTQLRKIEGDGDITLDNIGTLNSSYDVSTINFYNIGTKFGGKLYAVKNETISISITSSLFNQFYSDAGKLTGNATDGYSFTTPDSDATILGFNADEWDGDGSEASPYEIKDANQWRLLQFRVSNGKTYSGKYFKLVADITISRIIGSSDNKFCGTFDGNDHTLTVDIDDSGTQGAAPFRYIKDATIKNLTVAGTITSDSYHTAGIVGFPQGTTTIKNCKVTATLKLKNDYAGGIIGHGGDNNNITIEDCLFEGTMEGVDDSRSNIGGIWGWSTTSTPTIKNCLENGTYTNISSMHPIGLQGSTGTIDNSYYVNDQIGSPKNVCTVSGATKCSLTAPAEFCKTSSVCGKAIYVIGDVVINSVGDAYDLSNYDGTIVVTPTSVTFDGVELSADCYTYKVTKNGTDEDVTSGITTSGQYTFTLSGVSDKGYSGSESKTIEVGEGDGSEGNPFKIASDADWKRFATEIGKGNGTTSYYQLTANITVDTMVGTSDNKFSGTFDGNGNTIDVNISSSEQGAAPFHYIDGATIKNLKVTGSVTGSDYHAGGLVGFASAGTVTIENCLVSANVSANQLGSGIVGHAVTSNLIMTGCVYTGTITNTADDVTDNDRSLGGLVGWCDIATFSFKDCLFDGAYEKGTSNVEFHPIGVMSSGTSRTCSVSNTYYTVDPDDDNDGKDNILTKDAKHARSISPGQNVSLENAGTATDYDVSGIVSYGTGIKFNNVLYAGKSEEVSINLSNSYSGSAAGDGETLDYSVTAGSLSGTSNPYTLTMEDKDVTISYGISVADWDGSGTSDDPYLIKSNGQWELLATNVANGNSYNENYFTLSKDISVTKMIGTDADHAFRGIFDGDGYTLTVEFDTDEDICGPFRYTYGATIKNLTTTGTITTSNQHAGGVVGRNGTLSLTMENVHSSVTINSSYSGDACHGGLVGYAINATFTDCSFTGSLLGGNSSRCGGMLGWKSYTDGSSVIFTDCLLDPVEISVGSSSSQNFAAGKTELVTIDNCYYTTELGGSQGKAARSISASEGVTISNITLSEGGLDFNGTLYYGENDVVSLTLSHDAAVGDYTFSGYSASAGTLEGSDNPYSLTMPNENVTIGASWTKWSDVDEDTKTAWISDLYVPEGETIAFVPAEIEGGYTVTGIKTDAMKGKTNVTEIFLPYTDEPITIEDGALKIDDSHVATIHVPLALLDDYAKMNALKQNYEADKIDAMVTAKNNYWTFSCGVDVAVPNDVTVYTCQINSAGTSVVITEIATDVIKANNGVLLYSEPGDYTITVRHADNETAQTYSDNELVAVVDAKHFAPDEYYVLSGNEFHAIENDDTEVPACKAVLKKTSAAATRTLTIENAGDGTTSIRSLSPALSHGDGIWYTLSGQRIEKPSKKGLYILNGKKVVVK